MLCTRVIIDVSSSMGATTLANARLPSAVDML
jgi:hypothetical protein